MLLSGLAIGGIAALDWGTKPYISLGFLYLFPILILGGVLSRPGIVAVALVCTVLQEAFSNLPGNEAVIRLLFSSAGFIGTGMFVNELTRNRLRALAHVRELEDQIRLREDAEEQMRRLVESSPAAIVTIGADGAIQIANEAALRLLAPREGRLAGLSIRDFLPALHAVAQQGPRHSFRTALQCPGHRGNGELFLAGVWFSTYATMSGARLAAIIVDLSDDLRSREELSLDHLLKNTRILMSAVAHEIRNLSGAILVVYKNLSRHPGLESSEDFRALGSLAQSLERVSELELRGAPAPGGEAVDLGSVLDEFRILIEATLRESGIAVSWEISPELPLVWADRSSLIQVFLNLAQNSRRALSQAAARRLQVRAGREGRRVAVRFADSGPGVGAPEMLFRPFQPGAESSGLGLYVSRAVLRSFHGELEYEAGPGPGACFAVWLETPRGEGDG